MDMNELIHKLEKARTKDDLEALGIEHLGIDVDKRKTKEVLRAELIGEAESQADSAASQPQAGATEPEPSQAPNPDPEPEPQPNPEPAPVNPTEPTPPAPTPSAPTQSGYAGRMGRNRNTGRVMPWTSAMAGMSHMEEM